MGSVLKYGDKIFLQFNNKDQCMLCVDGAKAIGKNYDKSEDDNLLTFTWTVRSAPGSGITTDKDRRAGRQVWDCDIIHLQCNAMDNHWIYGQSSASTHIITGTSNASEWIVRKTIGDGRLGQPSTRVHVDFADLTLSSNTHTPELKEGAATVSCSDIGYVCNALRIDSLGPHALIKDVDIGPTAMPECTLMIGIRLNSRPAVADGWCLGHYNGTVNRHIVMHDTRLGGAVGLGIGVEWQPYINPEPPSLNEWLHVAAVYVQGGRCCVYVNGVRSDNSVTGDNGEGLTDLWIGRSIHSLGHWCDCWIKHVTVIDTALTDSEVGEYSTKFFEDMETFSTS